MSEIAENLDPWKELNEILLRDWPVEKWCDVGVVVGCSGGADSVALLRALCHRLSETQGARGFVIAAHFNHATRGEESEHDQQFVESLANSLGVRSVVGRSASSATDESSLRADRMAFLQSTAEGLGARYVTVAHTADDQAETVIHHLMRGTGPIGLAGIRRNRPLGPDAVLVRPLLSARRALLRAALESLGQSWRDDSSNTDTAYRRNWIRGELIPLIGSQYPSATEAICRAASAQRDWCDLIERLAARWLDTNWDGRQPVHLTREGDAEPPVLIAACQQLWKRLGWPLGGMSREQWLRIARVLTVSGDDQFTLPGGILVRATPQKVRMDSAKPG